jgi:23S rRNA (cytidine2498-2'-O)-methyltransferase
MTQTGYFAPLGLEKALESELKNIVCRYGPLFVAEGPPQTAYWTQNVWADLQFIPITSISDGVKKLRQLNKLWSFYPYQEIRRGHLITESLPHFAPKPLVFPCSLPQEPLGSWMLLDKNTILASAKCSSPFAQGEVLFQESKTPPSRAYLKLWEALVKIGRFPRRGEKCLELGASPGSWTWALVQLGAEVVACDRAPLDKEVASLPGVMFVKGDAFNLEFKEDFDWIFSDVICYPEKLLGYLQPYLDKPINMVCTLKFQGNEGYEIVREFEKIPGSQLMHLFNNKHELTWVRLITD